MVDATSVGAAFSRALKRARCIAAVFCSWVISPYSTLTSRTPRRPRTFDSTSRLIWPRSGQPGGGERDPYHDSAVVVDGDVVDHPEIDDAGVQLGVDDAPEHLPHVVTRRRRPRDRLVDGRAGIVGIRGVEHGRRHTFDLYSFDLENMPAGRYGQVMDQLAVLKALGDETRYAMYEELARSTAAMSAQDLADRLGLHPNTVRLHLDRLRDAGLVDVEPVHRGTVGRPQHLYFLAAGAPGLGFDPPAHALLAGLLAALAEHVGAVCGRRHPYRPRLGE